MTESSSPQVFGPAEFTAGGLAASAVFDELEARRTNDVRWREGRAFSLAYYAGPEAAAVAVLAGGVGLAVVAMAFPGLRALLPAGAAMLTLDTGWPSP